MNKFKVKCIKDVPPIFLKGNDYEAFWDGDGYNEPRVLIATDALGKAYHIIAQHSLDDVLFNEYFVKLN